MSQCWELTPLMSSASPSLVHVHDLALQMARQSNLHTASWVGNCPRLLVTLRSSYVSG